jgi:hypothetical protein
MKRRRLVSAVLIGFVLCASAIGYGLKKRSARKLELQKREALYRSALAAYSKDLKPGMTRKDVEDYLGARATPFEKGVAADLVKIGQERSPEWFCSELEVFVSFDFEAVEPHSRALEPHAMDVLKKAYIYSRAGGCL